MRTPSEGSLPPSLSPRSRSVAVAVWSGFLAAAVATMVCFAFIDPQAFEAGALPAWWGGRMQVYAIGFLFFFGIATAAAAIAVYLMRTEHSS